MAVVSRGLVRTQSHISSGLLELHARTYYTVYYAYGSRIDYHSRSSLGYERCLVSVAVGQVNSDEGAVQISQIVQKCRRSLAVSLLYLISLSVSLLYMHVDLGISFLCHLLYLEKEFR